MQEAKRLARRSALARRSTLSAQQCEEGGLRLADQALQSPLNEYADDVAAYVSMGTEISTVALLRALVNARHPVVVPLLGTGRDVLWGALKDASTLEDMGVHRPQEPATEALPPETLNTCNLIFVPALAVDHQGNRLGRGAAWYDQALLHRSVQALTVAVCWPWEFQREAIPCQEHDIPMDAVLTPESFTLLATCKLLGNK